MLNREHTRFITRLLLCCFLSSMLVSCAAFDFWELTHETDNYRARLDRGWSYLGKRQHSLALSEFFAAGRLQPEHAEPLHGQARAFLNMDRFEEALAACSELTGESAEYFDALGFCWGARLEFGRDEATTREEVRREIGRFVQRQELSVELLYSAYMGYYYLRDQKNRFSLIKRLAAEGAGSSVADSIARSLFSEIIKSVPGSADRVDLARSYIRNFPLGRMAGQAAAIVLSDLLAKQQDEAEHQEIIRFVLNDDEKSPLLNAAAAYWLIEQNIEHEKASQLLRKSLREIDSLRQEIPEPFSKMLWAEEIEQKRMLYKYLLGRAQLAQGKTEAARRLFEEVAAAHQDWPGPYHFLGMIALRENLHDQALRYFGIAMGNGSPRAETTEELRRLLGDHYGYAGEPLAYFQAQDQGPKFSDVTLAAGLDGVKGSRVAWGDYDNDGDDDFLLDGSRLFINHGGGSFSRGQEKILARISGSNGGLWGDYDNDGFLDIFVTSHQGNRLLHNEGGWHFTANADWPGAENHAPRTEAAAWGDLNNDGFLDLYVANYEHGAVMQALCGHDQLFINRGIAGFEESSAAVGVISEEGMCGRGVTWSDLNGDGWQDILVSNYRLDPNFLWLNQGNGSMIDVAETAAVRGHEVKGAYGHSIGSATGDLDGDGDLDIFTSNLAHPRYIEYSDKSMVLLNNDGPIPEFADRYDESGISFDETSSDPLLFDADLDGDLDLYVTSIYRNRSSHLYINNGNKMFRDHTWLGAAGVKNGWGAASADFNGDGYPDLLVASSDGVRLLRNDGGSNNWLAIRIDDHNCNHYGVGSKVTARFGEQTLVREVTAGRGTGSQDSLTVHLGLKHYQGTVSIEVKTLCGDTLKYQTSELNRVVVISNKPAPN